MADSVAADPAGMPPAPSPVRLLDGGLGTTLEDKYGVRFSSTSTPLWSSHMMIGSDDSKTLLDCQSDFCRAGIDILETATYQVSVAGFANTRLQPDFPNGIVNRKDISNYLENAVVVAEKATKAATIAEIGQRPSIALSLGPYGACMIPSTEYSGAYDKEGSGTAALLRWHADRLRLFADVPDLAERVQYIAYETVPRLDEIAAIRQLYRKDPGQSLSAALQSPHSQEPLPYWISCVFPGNGSEGDDDSRTALPDGTSVEQAVEAMLAVDPTPKHVASAQPWGVGINCTKIAKLPRLIERYEAAVSSMICGGKLSSWPALVLYPDGTNGEVYNTTTQQWELPDGQTAPTVAWEFQLSQIVKSTSKRGKWKEIVVGGCCRTTDRDLVALKKALQ